MTRPIPRERWSGELDRFTRRNAGRHTVLEVDDPDLGAQRMVESSLWGVSYDARDDDVELMFGDFAKGRSRFTHTVDAPQSIEIVEYEGGGDRVLRVVYPGGQALLYVDRPVR